MSDLPVVVLRSNDVCFLGICRSLGTAGVKVIPVTFTWKGAGPWYSERSRHITDPLVIPNPYEFPEEAAAAMVYLGQRLRAEYGARLMVVPSSDTNLMFMLDNEEAFSPYFRMMGHRDFDRMRPDVVRKHTCSDLLTAGGVALPRTVACLSAADIPRVLDEMTYPCVYKPLEKDYGQTFYRTHDGNKAVTCETREELAAKLPHEMFQGFKLVVQERVFFDSVYDELPCYVYADRDHRVRMMCTAIKEKIQPFPYGTATVLRLSHHPELLDAAEKVTKALAWRGVLMIEFIRDKKDGVFKVIEVNGRPWLFVDFFRRAGLPYLGYLAQDMRNETADWPALRVPDAQVLKESPVHVALPTAFEPAGPHPEVEDVVSYLRSIPGAKSLTFLDPTDDGPGLMELSDLATRYGMRHDALVHAVVPELSRF